MEIKRDEGGKMLDLISFNVAEAHRDCNIVIDTVDMMLRCGVDHG
jgi:hypothetical protein